MAAVDRFKTRPRYQPIPEARRGFRVVSEGMVAEAAMPVLFSPLEPRHPTNRSNRATNLIGAGPWSEHLLEGGLTMSLRTIIAGTDQQQDQMREEYVVCYSRVSTAEQGDRDLSIPSQIAAMERFAADRDLTICDHYVEVHSGYDHSRDRPQFNCLVERAIRDPIVTGVLVSDLSRFGRDSVHAQETIRLLRDHGVHVLSASGEPSMDEESPSSVLVEAVLWAQHEAYSRQIAAHTRRGQRENCQRRDEETGWVYHNGASALWGYRLEHLDRGTDRRGAPIVKTIWALDHRLVAGRAIHDWCRRMLVQRAAGVTLPKLRDWLNGLGVPAPRKPLWRINTLSCMLTEDCLLKYAGFGLWNVHRRNGQRRPPGEWVIVERAHPAIIGLGEAEQIAQVQTDRSQARLQRSHGRTPGRKPGPRPRTGQLFEVAPSGKIGLGTMEVTGEEGPVVISLEKGDDRER